MCPNRRAHGNEARGLRRIDEIQAYSERVDTNADLAKNVVSGEYPAEDEHPMDSEGALFVSQATLFDAITGIAGLIEDEVTSSVTTEG